MRQLRGEIRVLPGNGTTFEAHFPKKDDRKGKLNNGQPQEQSTLGLPQLQFTNATSVLSLKLLLEVMKAR